METVFCAACEGPFSWPEQLGLMQFARIEPIVEAEGPCGASEESCEGKLAYQSSCAGAGISPEIHRTSGRAAICMRASRGRVALHALAKGPRWHDSA